MNTRVHTNGTAISRRSRAAIYITLAVILLTFNLMSGLFDSVSGGCFKVLDLSVSEEYLTIYNGDSYALAADVLSRGEGEIDFVWQSGDEAILTVSENGMVSALAEGKTTVTVTETATGKQAECVVTVLGLSDITVNLHECSLGVGEKTEYTAQSANGVQIEYTSANPDVASVDAAGVITARAPGTTNIIASGTGCGERSCAVTVMAAPTKLSFTSPLGICEGETRTLTVKPGEGEYCANVDIAVEGEAVQLSEDGTLTALTAGSATVTATAYNGVSVTTDITVKGKPTAVTLKVADSSLYTGDTTQLTPGDNTGVCRQFTYSSADSSIATVDENGLVTAVKKGSTTITCQSYNGVSASCTVSIAIVDYTRPYTSALVTQNVHDLAASYPELITCESIGKSTCGSDIWLMKVGHGEKKALITGGIHSREDITINYVMRCVEEYADAYYSKTGRYGSFRMNQLLEQWTLYVVPAMNPDGTDIANAGMQPLWKEEPLTEEELFDYKNTATGVNLNRNFPFEWGYESAQINRTTPDIDGYTGKSEASEPETQAIIKLCSENAFEWLYSIHIKGNMLYWADSINSNAEKAEIMSNRLVVNCKFNLMRTSTVDGASGGMENWFRAEYNKPGFCIELMEDKWSSEVNKYFEKKINWAKTRYAIVLGMVYG